MIFTVFTTDEYYSLMVSIFIYRCLHSSGGYLPFKPEKCALVVETCMKLHNMAINERVPLRNGGAVANQHNNAVYQGAAPLRARELRQQLASRF